MELRLNQFFRKYANAGMWSAGALTLPAFVLKESSPVLSAGLYLAAAGSPILFRGRSGAQIPDRGY